MKRLHTVLIFLLSLNWIYCQITLIPDPCFEQNLIWNNIDSDEIVNGQVATSDIKDVTELRLGYNCIKDLTGLQDFTSLKVLHFRSDVFNHELTSFDAELTPSLEVLTFFYYPKLLELKVDQAVGLVHLSVRGTKISQIDLSQNKKLTSLDLVDNQMNEIILDQNILLQELFISQDLAQNSIEKIDVSNNTQLRILGLINLPFKEIDVSQNKELTQLSLGYCQISNLDVSHNSKLNILDIRHNEIKSIDVSNNPNLTDLTCFNNKITSLDVKYNTELTYLECQNNKISSLNITNNNKLFIFQCYNNDLSSLSAKNGNNQNIEWFDSSNNPNLYCIEPDNAYLANNSVGIYEEWITDPGVIYSDDCQYILGIDDEYLANNLKIYPNPIMDKLNVESESIDVSKMELYDSLGKLLIKTDSNHINTESLSRGIYFLKVFSDNGFISKKIVKI